MTFQFELAAGLHTLTVPSGVISTFNVAVPGPYTFAADAGHGTYRVVGPNSAVFEFVYAPETTPVTPASVSVEPTVVGPADVVVITTQESGIFSFWGMVRYFKAGTVHRLIAPSTPGDYQVTLAGEVVSTVTVVPAVTHNAKVACNTADVPVTYSLELEPTSLAVSGSSMLTICATNLANVSADFALPRITLPAGFLASPPIEVPGVTLGPNSRQCRHFVITAVNKTDSVMVAPVSLGTAEVALTVTPAPATPKVQFSAMTASALRAKIGSSFYVELVFVNPTSTECELTVGLFNIPASVSVEGATAFTHTIAAKGYYTHRLYCVAKGPEGPATIQVPDGAVTATSGGVRVTISGSRSVTITQIP